MIGKIILLKKQQKQGTRVETYSIKKFKVGAASVLVGVVFSLEQEQLKRVTKLLKNTAGKIINVDAGAKQCKRSDRS